MKTQGRERSSAYYRSRTLLCLGIVMFMFGCVKRAPVPPEDAMLDVELFAPEEKRRFLAQLIDTREQLQKRKKNLELVKTLDRFQELLLSTSDPKIFAEKFRNEFEFESRGEAYFTGYFRPVLSGSLKRTDRFRYPLYARPQNLPNPHPERRALLTHLHGHELVFVDDVLDTFLAQIQGSTAVRLENGEVRYYRYDGATDHPYVSLGGELIRDGKLMKGEASIPKIREYFAAHPGELDEYLNRNSRFVFFREGDARVLGALGVPLLDFRAVALDPETHPLGTLLFYEVKLPRRTRFGWEERPVKRFALGLDTGSAIKGVRRFDLYMGQGSEAGEIAGRLSKKGFASIVRASGERLAAE